MCVVERSTLFYCNDGCEGPGGQVGFGKPNQWKGMNGGLCVCIAFSHKLQRAIEECSIYVEANF